MTNAAATQDKKFNMKPGQNAPQQVAISPEETLRNSSENQEALILIEKIPAEPQNMVVTKQTEHEKLYTKRVEVNPPAIRPSRHNVHIHKQQQPYPLSVVDSN